MVNERLSSFCQCDTCECKSVGYVGIARSLRSPRLVKSNSSPADLTDAQFAS